MRKLNVRKVGGQTYHVGIGPCGGPTVKQVTDNKGDRHTKVGLYEQKPEQVVTVTAANKQEALRLGKELWRKTFGLSLGEKFSNDQARRPSGSARRRAAKRGKRKAHKRRKAR